MTFNRGSSVSAKKMDNYDMLDFDLLNIIEYFDYTDADITPENLDALSYTAGSRDLAIRAAFNTQLKNDAMSRLGYCLREKGYISQIQTGPNTYLYGCIIHKDDYYIQLDTGGEVLSVLMKDIQSIREVTK